MEREVVPNYVKRMLDYWLDVEIHDPEMAGPKITALSEKWGF